MPLGSLTHCSVLYYGASERWSVTFWSDSEQVYLRRPAMCISPLIVIQPMTMVCMPYGN